MRSPRPRPRPHSPDPRRTARFPVPAASPFAWATTPTRSGVAKQRRAPEVIENEGMLPRCSLALIGTATRPAYQAANISSTYSRAVLHDQRDSVAGGQPMAPAQIAPQDSHPAGKPAIVQHRLRTGGHGRILAAGAPRSDQKVGHIHRSKTPFRMSIARIDHRTHGEWTHFIAAPPPAGIWPAVAR